MAKAPTFSTITAAFASASKLNANNAEIVTAFNNTLSRDGSTPNTMTADFDMNNQDILNIKVINAEGVRIGGVDTQLSVANPVLQITRNTIATTNITAATVLLTTAGFAAVGDGGAGSYKRVGVEPSHALKVTSLDGAFWELVPGPNGINVGQAGAFTSNTAAVNTIALQNAFSFGGDIAFDQGIYLNDTDLTMVSGSSIDMRYATLSGAGIVMNGVTNVSLVNGKFTGVQGVSTRVVHVTNGTTKVYMANLWADRVDNGFAFDGVGTLVSEIRTNNLSVTQCKGSPYFHFNAEEVHHGNLYTFNAGWGFNLVAGCKDVVVDAAWFELGAASTTPTGDDTYYTGTPEHGIYIHQSNGIYFGNLIVIGWNRSGGASGYKMRNIEDVNIASGHIENCTLPFGIFIQTNSIQDYVRNVRINSVTTVGNSSSIFVEDQVGIGAGAEEMEVTFNNCIFGEDGLQLNNVSDDPSSLIIFNGCTFSGAFQANAGTWLGMRKFSGCAFITATLFNISVGPNVVLTGCTSHNWNTSNVSPTTNLENAEVASISLFNGAKNVRIIGHTFLQDDERRLAGWGTTAGSIGNIVFANSIGGGDVWVFQSGTTVDIYMSGCTNYSSVIGGGDIVSTGNNMKLNDDATFTAY